LGDIGLAGGLCPAIAIVAARWVVDWGEPPALQNKYVCSEGAFALATWN